MTAICLQLLLRLVPLLVGEGVARKPWHRESEETRPLPATNMLERSRNGLRRFERFRPARLVYF